MANSMSTQFAVRPSAIFLLESERARGRERQIEILMGEIGKVEGDKDGDQRVYKEKEHVACDERKGVLGCLPALASLAAF